MLFRFITIIVSVSASVFAGKLVGEKKAEKYHKEKTNNPKGGIC